MRMKTKVMPHMASVFLLISVMALPATSQEQEVELDDRLVAFAESAQEFDAINALEAEESAINRLTLSDAFLTEYPESQMKQQALIVRLQTYVGLENNQAIVTTGEAYIEAENAFYEAKLAEIGEDDTSEVDGFTIFQLNHMANLTYGYQSLMNASRALNRVEESARYGDLAFDTAEEAWSINSQIHEDGSTEYQELDQRRRQAQLFFLQTVMSVYQDANDAERTVEYAERALGIDPQSLPTLITISSVLSERPPEDESQHEAHFESAEEYAEQALETLENFLDAVGARCAGHHDGQVGQREQFSAAATEDDHTCAAATGARDDERPAVMPVEPRFRH